MKKKRGREEGIKSVLLVFWTRFSLLIEQKQETKDGGVVTSVDDARRRNRFTLF